MGKIAEVQEVTLTMLRPYEKNAKIHGEGQIEKIKASINEFGFVSPCLIDRDYNIIAGHGRVMAAKELGMEKVPCVFIEGLTDEQRRAYILADNRLGELGEWDMELVTSELEALKELDFDISLTGFDFELDIDNETFEDKKYTTVVDIPQYLPSEEETSISDCYDAEKYHEMLKEIEYANVSEEEKELLRLAASRHIVFSYKKIADYYAKAEPDMQFMMERSALVIIDVEDAIKYGYAELSSYLDEIEERERGEE